MKTLRTLVLAVFLFLVSLSPAIAQSISTAEAKKHIGEGTTVCGKVVNVWTAKDSYGVPTFIDLDFAFPKEVFRIVVWEEDRAELGELPRIGSQVCATGMIRAFKGLPEIVVRSTTQLSY
jgi:hypothetical protein